MLVIAIVPLIAAVVGVLMFALCSGDAKEIGRALMWCGLLATLLAVAHKTVSLGGG